MSHEHGAEVGIICNHVLHRERPANLVAHLPDGSWDFMCGEEDGHDTADDASVICAGCGFEIFVDGVSMEEIPPGFAADRPTKHNRWVIRPMTEDELSDEED